MNRPLPKSFAARMRATSSRGIGVPSASRANVAQDVGVPRPLLEHLRRRLDEVPLRRHAGEPRPLLAAAEDVVHEVPELVEQRHDVVVLHQPAREVADQHALGQLPAGDAGDEVELRRVLELALARVQVEIDAAEHAPCRRTARRSRRRPRATRSASGTGRYSRPNSRPVTSSRPCRTRPKSK